MQTLNELFRAAMDALGDAIESILDALLDGSAPRSMRAHHRCLPVQAGCKDS